MHEAPGVEDVSRTGDLGMTVPVNEPWYMRLLGELVFAATLYGALRFLLWVRFRDGGK